MKLWLRIRVLFLLVCAGMLLAGNAPLSGGGKKGPAKVSPQDKVAEQPAVVGDDNDVVPLPPGMSFEDVSNDPDGLFSPRKPRPAVSVLQADLAALGARLGVVVHPGGAVPKEDGEPRAGEIVTAGAGAPTPLVRKTRLSIPVLARREDGDSGSDGEWSAEEVGELTARIGEDPLSFEQFYALWREKRQLIVEIYERLGFFQASYALACKSTTKMATLVDVCNDALGRQMAETGAASAIVFSVQADLLAQYDKAYEAYRSALTAAELLCMGAVQWQPVDLSGMTPAIEYRLPFLHLPTCVRCPGAFRGRTVTGVFDVRLNEVRRCQVCDGFFLRRFFDGCQKERLGEEVGALVVLVDIAMNALIPLSPGFVSHSQGA